MGLEVSHGFSIGPHGFSTEDPWIGKPDFSSTSHSSGSYSFDGFLHVLCAFGRSFWAEGI